MFNDEPYQNAVLSRGERNTTMKPDDADTIEDEANEREIRRIRRTRGGYGRQTTAGQAVSCARCTGLATTTVTTRHFGPEKLCAGCAANVRRDGQEVALTPDAGPGEWHVGGKFISDCEETLSGMYAVYNQHGKFYAAAQTREHAEQIVRDHNAVAGLVAALEDLVHQLPTDERLANYNLDRVEAALAAAGVHQ